MTPRALRLALLGALLAAPATAHELRPSYLELSPGPAGRVDVTWKVAFALGAAMPLRVVLPERCVPIGPARETAARAATVTSWSVDCGPGGLAGATLAVRGLEETGTDVLVRVARGGTFVLRPEAPAVTLPAPGGGPGAGAFLVLGLEHILLGADHLVFVLGLLLLVGPRPRALLWTVTAFTAAHSVTLAAAALGLVVFPTRAVEAIIALSIVLLAWELARPPAATPSFARRWPWAFALACGLLHGLGFAGALSEIGLPAGDVPLALLLFNLGVELGQLAFIGAAALALRLLDPKRNPGSPGSLVLVRGMGGVGAFWLLDRGLPILTSAMGRG